MNDKTKLLVVDDAADACEFVKSYFQRKGLEVLVAFNGQQALLIIEKEKPQIILLDIRMPHPDGIEVLRLTKKIDPNIKVLMITAVKDSEEKRVSQELGCDGYLTKAIDPEVWEDTIMKLVSEIQIKK